MPHKRGTRTGTRQKYCQPFRRAGAIRMNNYLRTTKIGDYVDVVTDPSQHKGMPHFVYHANISEILNKIFFVKYFGFLYIF